MNHSPFVADAPHVFLIVPFDDEHVPAQRAMRNAAASLGLGCFRSDDIRRSTAILDRVIEGIRSAAVVVADLTANRANCYYELGYADALNRPVVLLRHAYTEPAFDVSGRSICTYDDAARLEAQLPGWLMEAAFVNHTVSDAADPNAGRFGRWAVRDGYLLAANLAPGKPAGRMAARVAASVRRVDGKPLPGNARIRFFLDAARCADAEQEGDILNGVARCTFEMSGAFSLGARVGSTMLELDLRHIPG
ncbi:MAG: hypothetical protein AMXMBFR59_37630 [Rhodanobacteraceae bacterium]